MSADIVNLRQARKARDRLAKEKRSEENRAKFGRTKAERTTVRADAALQKRRLDALRRDENDGPDPTDGGTAP